MIGKRCGHCEFYAYHTSSFDCCVPQWMPLKNMIDINSRMPTDCPIRNTPREEAEKQILKQIKEHEKDY